MKSYSMINLNILNRLALIIIGLMISSCSNLITNKENKIINEIKQQKGAINYYSKELLKDPKNEKLLFDRGLAKYEYGDYKGAINDFDKAFNISNDLTILYSRAITKGDYGDYKGAINDYKKLLMITDLKKEICVIFHSNVSQSP